MKHLTLSEKFEELKRNINMERWNYTLSEDKWFFPSDVVPHSTQIKYWCKQLYEAGFLEREGDGTARWGYRYKIIKERTEQ